MSFASKSCISTVLLLVLAAGCSTASSRPTTETTKRWVLVSNPRYSAQGSEREYMWVEEDKIPTSLTTVVFGKKMAIAPASEVPRYAPPPGNGTISPLQGGIYAQANAQPVATTPAAPKARPPEPAARPDSRASGAPAPPAPAPLASAPRAPAPSAAAPAPAPPASAPRAPAPVASVPPAPAAPASAPPAAGVLPRGYVVYVEPTRVVIDLNVQHGLKVGPLGWAPRKRRKIGRAHV